MRVYLVLAFVGIVSFLLALWLPTTEFLKGIIATPSVLALIGVLYQSLRDQSEYERKERLQKQQQIFNIGATSHMADVAFDRHVEFCEKYMKEVHDAVVTLYREGPTKTALDHAKNLSSLRQDYGAWIGEDINDRLFPFEQALRTLGAKQTFISDTINAPQYSEHRAKAIKAVYADFRKILTIEEGREPDPDIAVESVKTKIRQILDIEDLIHIRKQLISEAKSAIDRD